MNNELTVALRQYRSNNKDEFIFGYDIQEVGKLFNKLKAENQALISLIIECTDNGEFDSRLVRSYIDHILK